MSSGRGLEQGLGGGQRRAAPPRLDDARVARGGQRPGAEVGGDPQGVGVLPGHGALGLGDREAALDERLGDGSNSRSTVASAPPRESLTMHRRFSGARHSRPLYTHGSPSAFTRASMSRTVSHAGLAVRYDSRRGAPQDAALVLGVLPEVVDLGARTAPGTGCAPWRRGSPGCARRSACTPGPSGARSRCAGSGPSPRSGPSRSRPPRATGRDPPVRRPRRAGEGRTRMAAIETCRSIMKSPWEAVPRQGARVPHWVVRRARPMVAPSPRRCGIRHSAPVPCPLSPRPLSPVPSPLVPTGPALTFS